MLINCDSLCFIVQDDENSLNDKNCAWSYVWGFFCNLILLSSLDCVGASCLNILSFPCVFVFVLFVCFNCNKSPE